ncbi:MAG: Asp-tRNA(Asn)/Glu-tRNA(Gln) amidotransferase subunit GatA [Treponema sp.]
MNICDMTLVHLKQSLAKKEITSLQIVQALRENYEKDEKKDIPIHGFLEFFDDAEKIATEKDEMIAKGIDLPLLGLPIAIKDNISIKGKLCTCCSNVLKNYIAPYNATLIERLISAGAVIVGRANMDELAMGSSTEFSCFGPSRNPVDRSLTPGGSSGGSSAIVAAKQCPFALGTETGGSVRLPAAYCGIYGLKPTYGLLSRYGVTAFSSSLDQVGLFSRSSDDIALILSVLVGKDERDETSSDVNPHIFDDLTPYTNEELKKLHCAVPLEFLNAEGLDKEIATLFDNFIKTIEELGIKVDKISMPILSTSIPTYYVLAMSEAASNLSRIDGIRYGVRVGGEVGFDDLYIKTRTEGFGSEVKRRIITGNYILSKGLSGDCYENSLKARNRIQKDVEKVFENYDFILCPTSPTPAFKLGEKVDDPIAMYLSDLFTTFVNLARVPSLSIPLLKTKAGLPIGVQIVAKHFAEKSILQLAKNLEVINA